MRSVFEFVGQPGQNEIDDLKDRSTIRDSLRLARLLVASSKASDVDSCRELLNGLTESDRFSKEDKRMYYETWVLYHYRKRDDKKCRSYISRAQKEELYVDYYDSLIQNMDKEKKQNVLKEVGGAAVVVGTVAAVGACALTLLYSKKRRK